LIDLRAASKFPLQNRKCIPSLQNKGFRDIIVDGSASRAAVTNGSKTLPHITNASPAVIESCEAMLRATFLVIDATARFADHFAQSFAAESPAEMI
jgi:hypothetical protein